MFFFFWGKRQEGTYARPTGGRGEEGNRVKRNREKRVSAAVNVRPKINYTLGSNGHYTRIIEFE